MEPIVENTSEITQEILCKALRKGMKTKFKVIPNLLIVLIIILSVLLSLFAKDSTAYIISVIGFCAGIFFFFYSNVILLRISASRAYKRMQIFSNDNTINITTRFYEGHLEQSYNDSDKRTIRYRDLEKYYITDKLYILRVSGNMIIMMRKDSFTKGTMEEAHKLIWENKRY